MTELNRIKILFIEDLPSDVDLAVLELTKDNIKFEHITVCTRKDLIKALKDFKPDVIISDYMMPVFNGLQALKVVKEFDQDIPFILYTGSCNEETAVECIKAGADDYVIKEHSTRLPIAVEEALEKVMIRKEKRASELLLRESEEKLQSIFNSTQVGIGLMINKILIEVNDSFCKMTGYERKELIGKSSEILSPSKEEMKSAGVGYYNPINEEGTGTIESKMRCKSGKILDIILNVSPLNINDYSKGATFTMLDITERKQFETALLASEERFRILYNDAILGLYRTNSRGEILLVNRAMLKILGFQSFEELNGRNIKETYYGPVYERNQFFDKIEKEGEVKDLESIWICRDGNEIFVRESAKAIYDSEGKILYYDGTVEDITEQKKAAQALNKIQHLFETLALASPVGIFRTDPDGSTTYVNPKWSQLSGLSPAEALGNGWLNAVHPEDREKLSKKWLDDFKSNNESTAEYRFVKPDGSIVWVMGKAVPEMIDNVVTGYIGTITDISERKWSEESLMESETKYRQLVTHSPDGIFIVDLSGNFLSVNQTICDSLNYSGEVLLSMNIWDIVPEKYHSIHQQRLGAIMKGESTKANVEYEVIGKDGIEHFVEVLSVPYYKGKKLVGFQGIARDITERKKAEEILRSSEERLKILFDYAPDAYYLNDFKGNFIDGNIACEKLMGYSRDELVGKNFLKLNLLSLSQIPLAAKLLINNTLGQVTGPDEFELTRKDGSKVTVEIVSHPVKIKGQTLVLGIARDISERIQTEKAIRESEEKYRRIFENVQDLYYETTMEGTILEVSPSIELLSGRQYRREDLIGKSMYDFFSDPSERETLLSVLSERGFVSDFEITLKNRNGLVIPCSISSKLLFDIKGNPEKIIGSVRDITDRKNASDTLRLAKEKAVASDNLKTAFLNNISHEVRTPLNGILGFAEIVSQPDLSEDEKKDSLAMLSESSDRLLETITNYMDISLLTSGNMSVYKKDFNPGKVLRSIFNDYENKCSNKKLAFVLKIPGQTENISINSDTEIFRKIISHLLNNAIKFTDKGSIHYGYLVLKENLEFFVKDTGIGIGKESIEMVFANFTKEDRGPLYLSEGSGLGLSIVKGMVDVIGGNIRVESELGVGSCFYFTIPHMKDTEITPSGTSGSEQKKPISGDKILVAEDDETNFFFLNALLSRETGAKILHASNGREAIDLFKANPDIILILMDIKMPVIDGLEATKQIKLLNQDVPVIAITAYAMSGDEERVLAAGCDSYLSKPISKKSLLDKLAEFIKI